MRRLALWLDAIRFKTLWLGREQMADVMAFSAHEWTIGNQEGNSLHEVVWTFFFRLDFLNHLRLGDWNDFRNLRMLFHEPSNASADFFIRKWMKWGST